MQKDYYAFLKVAPDTTQMQLERTIRRLKRRWSGYRTSVLQEPEVIQKLDELIEGLGTISTCFSDPQKKREYDRMFRFGRAPLVGESIEGGSSGPDLNALRLQIQKGKYEQSLVQLKELQKTVGLSSDILAEIGWCHWNLNHREEALDSIRLALGLDGHQLYALEYDARIALAMGEPMRARKRLALLLQLQPYHKWAQVQHARLEDDGGMS